MSILKSVITATQPQPPKGIIYGPPGIGKTTFAAQADALIIDCENGAGAIPCIRTPYLDQWPAIKEVLDELLETDHQYHIVAIDSLDWCVRRIEEAVIGSDNNIASTLNKAHGGYGNGEHVLRNYIYHLFLPTLDKLVAKGMAVILLAHAERHDVTDVDGVTMTKTAPDLPKKHLNCFIEWSDFVGCAKLLGDDRVLVLRDQPQLVAKNRYSMPAEIPFSWDSFMKAYQQYANA